MARKPKGRAVDGVFLLDKPAGMSSNKVLQKIKHLYGAAKAGHTGALDPLATGLLPICLGEATKFSQYLLDADKAYLTTARLGEKTDTADADGEVTETRPVPDDLTASQVEALLQAHFQGEIEQVPPIYSALKVQGQPMYKLARKGIQVEVKPRQVRIDKIRLLALRDQELDLEIHCSKGTYIRSIVQDLGELLGCGAHVSRLRRIRTGQFDQSQMLSLEALDEQIKALQTDDPHCIQNSLDTLLLPPWSAIESLPDCHLTDEQAVALLQGRTLVDLDLIPASEWRVFEQSSGRFLGLAETDSEARLKGKRLVRTDTQLND
ncbi:tRNA pseudouridine(55) synthase TruB [Nitrincola iocasae]|uniref:tRNA pseudouridine synthase B n=1 Tax=Nitrincola iocasae TaxID=2614693 RepID=A0A5J6LAH0_9GAMM|nr:tRNA pseudouridine(55) synthase TruB [Nitrincola iocasae]QEW05507.1 tRNA pseudouridine(55) synthase TruB [Nitrincola iocasae]